MNDNGYFITGTDTGIGKTVVSTALAIGLDAHYWKPIQTGSNEGTDSNFVGKWLGKQRVLPESYVFPEPLSPHLAAKVTGAEIDHRRCLDYSFTLPRRTIIEGAGGVLVPINSTFMMIDLIKALERSVIIVASTKLGTINHTLLTLEALKARQIPVAGVVTVGKENSSIREGIELYGGTRGLGHVPQCSTFSLSWFQEAYRNITIENTISTRKLCTTT